MYICVCEGVRVCDQIRGKGSRETVPVCVYIYIYIYIYMGACVCVWVYMCVCVCAREHIYVCVREGVYVYVCKGTYVCRNRRQRIIKMCTAIPIIIEGHETAFNGF